MTPEQKLSVFIYLGLGLLLLPSKTMEQAYAPLDFLVWGIVAMVIQLAMFLAIKKILGNFVEQIKQDRVGEAVILAAMSIAVGILSSAAMTE